TEDNTPEDTKNHTVQQILSNPEYRQEVEDHIRDLQEAETTLVDQFSSSEEEEEWFQRTHPHTLSRRKSKEYLRRTITRIQTRSNIEEEYISEEYSEEDLDTSQEYVEAPEVPARKKLTKHRLFYFTKKQIRKDQIKSLKKV